MRKINEKIKIIVWALKTAFLRNPWGYLVYLLLNFVSIILGISGSVYVGRVVNSIVKGAENGTSIYQLICMIMSIGLLEVCGIVIDGVYWRYVQDIMPKNYRVKAQKQIVFLTQKIDLELFDKQYFQEAYSKFCQAYADMDNMVTGIISIIAHLYRQITISILVASINIWFSVVNIVFLIVGLIIEMKSVTFNKQIRNDATFDSRLAAYYDEMFVGKNRDTRLLELTETFIARYVKHNRRSTNIKRYIWKKKDALTALLFPVTNQVASIVTIALGLLFIKNGCLDIGMFYTAWSLSIGSISQSQNLQRSLSIYANSIAIAYEAYEFIERYIEKSKQYVTICSSCTKPIEIEHLTFAYQEGENVLDDVSLSINRGESVALVGENGSGKSTLIKCILGLYKPTKGSVKLFGGEASLLPDNKVAEMVGVTFQDYNKYKFSLRECVGLGNISKLHEDDTIIKAILKAGADEVLNHCNGNLDTVLDRTLDKDGVVPSGGQWQKLALARAYISDKDLMIFDEPGAALDPISELSQFNEIKSTMRNKTTILVSHRIGFARMADRIIVLRNGRVVEDGSHNELIEKEGEYARLYYAQKQWYDAVEE